MDSGLFTQAHLICHHKTIKKKYSPSDAIFLSVSAPISLSV